MRIDQFSEISQSYKVILLDSYGVLRSHNGLIRGSSNAYNVYSGRAKHPAGTDQ